MALLTMEYTNSKIAKTFLYRHLYGSPHHIHSIALLVIWENSKIVTEGHLGPPSFRLASPWSIRAIALHVIRSHSKIDEAILDRHLYGLPHHGALPVISANSKIVTQSHLGVPSLRRASPWSIHSIALPVIWANSTIAKAILGRHLYGSSHPRVYIL